MDICYNSNAKNPYFYNRYYVNEITEKVLCRIIEKNNTLERGKINNSKCKFRKLKVFKVGKGKYSKSYFDINMGFDIETTSINEKNAFMWQWKLCINEEVIEGRYWEEFINLLDLIKKVISPSKNQRLICWIHNEGFEFQFLRKWLKIDGEHDSFFKEERKPCFVIHDKFIVFQDSMLISNSSLERLAKDYTNTQKAKGDLDYTVIRNNKWICTEKENKYSDNDVLILSEFSRYYNKTYLINGFKPLTKTSALNKLLVDCCKVWCEKNDLTFEEWQEILDELNCGNYEEYLYLVNWVYRGGYVHGNESYVGMLFEFWHDIKGFDITSSYPATMFLQYFPMSKFEDVECNSFDELIELCKAKCVITQITFYNIRRTTTHSIESKSKCIECEGEVLDNGRIRKADKITVALTELDLQSYLEFYEWDIEKTVIHFVSVAERGLCFEYLVRCMLDFYVKKDELKKAGLPYDIEKSFVNTFYGLCVKRLSEDVVNYYGGEWHTKKAKGYDEQMEKSVLSTFVGVYISAHARRNLLKVVYRLYNVGKTVLYVDTDSLKILFFDDVAKKVIDDYNMEIYELLKKRCNYYKVDIEKVKDLGMFDLEYDKVINFKYLGAKRYLISYLKKDKKTGKQKLCHNQVVAGVPKNLLFNRYYWKKVYDIFEDNLVIKDCKLTSFYIDDGCEMVVDGVLMKERSALSLIPCEFNLDIEETWLLSFLDFQLSNEGREFRILG